MEHLKTDTKKVSGEKVKEILDRGSDYAFDKMQEYCKDVQTLCERMKDLYHADDEVAMLFSILGLKVKVTVECQSGDIKLPLLNFGCGATLNEVNTEGDNDGVQEQ